MKSTHSTLLLSSLLVMLVCTGCPEPERHGLEPYGYGYGYDGSDCTLTRQDHEQIVARLAEISGQRFVSDLDRISTSGSSYSEVEEMARAQVLRATLTIDEASRPMDAGCDIRPEFLVGGTLTIAQWSTPAEGEPELMRVLVDEQDVLVKYQVYGGEDHAYRASLFMQSENQTYSDHPPEPNSITYRVRWAEYRGEMLVTDIYVYEFGQYIDEPDDYFIGNHPELGGP